jgi:LPS export ABC transporter protein LptC
LSQRYLVCVLILLGCGKEKAGPVAGAGFQSLPANQVILGFQQYISQVGRKRAVIQGDTAYIFDDSSLAKVKHANMTIYDDAGHQSAQLTSLAGDVNTNTQGMIARGNVVLRTATDGCIIQTEELHYDPNQHRVWSNVATKQICGGAVSSGTGFDADDKFINVRVTGARTSGGGLRITF